MYDVLIVDDEPLVRVALKSLIPWEDYGCRCELEAGNGEQALELFAGRPGIAVVFLDISMPVMNGLEFLRRLRLGGHEPEVIVLSAHGEYPLVRDAFKLGAFDYILKSDMDRDHIGRILETVRGNLERKLLEKLPESTDGMELLRKEARRNLFTPGGVSGRARAELLALKPGYLLRVAALWVEDFQSVVFRYGRELATFHAALENSVLQVLSSRAGGQAVKTADDEFALILPFEPQDRDTIEQRTEELVTEIQKTLIHYLNIHVTIRYGRVGDVDSSLYELYEEAKKYRLTASRIVVKAKKYIREHYAEPDLSLTDLARLLDISRNHVSYQFARETGETFKEYLMKVRVEAAKKLLLETNMKVYEVSEKVGYRNVESFCRVFKRLTGRPPGSFSTETGAD